jgi:SAM-dependent methyltransferase
MSLKQGALHMLRRAHVLQMVDAARFRWVAFAARDGRFLFRRQHGAVPLPPDDVAYDAYGSLDWEFYWGFGRLIAEFIGSRMLARSGTGRVLEWGCGPARIVRHLPEVLGAGWEVHGCDANGQSIRWCATHLPTVHFTETGHSPPLPFPSGEFDCVYAVSVFTHLSEDLHRRWATELRRVLKPDGLLICTLHGDAGRSLLLPFERARFDSGLLVVRGAVAQGTRCFLAYHPLTFVVKDLLRGFDVVEHLPAPNILGTRQDIWIARNRAASSSASAPPLTQLQRPLEPGDVPEAIDFAPRR